MNKEIFNNLNMICKKIGQKNDFELFQVWSKLYIQFVDFINDKKFKQIAFFARRHDCIDYYAIIDYLNKTNKIVYILETDVINLIPTIVDDIANFVKIEDGIYSYPVTQKFSQKNLDILVYPAQIVNNNFVYIYNNIEYNFIKKFKGLKIAIGYKESLIDNVKLVKNDSWIKFDKIILV